MAAPHPFRLAAENKDLEAMTDVLREDVVLHSPILFRGFEGREIVLGVLTHVVATLEDFRYTDELARATPSPCASRPASATASSRASTSSSWTPTARSPS